MTQPSSGTVLFNPALGDLVLESFARIQIRPASLTPDHMVQARMSANFVLNDFVVDNGPNLWKQELRSVDLVQGTPTYTLDNDVVAITDYYIRLPPQNSTNPTDLVITPISRTEYADQPNKLVQALPTTVFFLRTITPSLTVWPCPDQNGPYVLYYWAIVQIQDAVVPQGVTMDLPYRFLDAFCAGLAAKLAIKYPPPPPNSAVIMQQLADIAWQKASQQDVEDVPLFITPGLSSFYR